MISNAKELIDKVNKEKIIIYGAGNYGQKFYHYLKNFNVDIDFFCETNPEKESFICGVPVISKKKLVELSSKVIILICVADKKSSSYIYKSIKMLMYDRATIIECGYFIKQLEDNGKSTEKKYCIACDSYIDKFEPHGESTEIHNRHKISGNGYRENCTCPKCGCIDRTRWVIYVLEKYTDILSRESSVLHIAPTKSVKEVIRLNNNCDYYSGDILFEKADHKVDVLDIQFKDSFFDFIIINHVLEHIEEEKKAIYELKRVLKKNGKLIMSFPICLDQDTCENMEYDTPELRKRYYGYEDHVRLYGKDFKAHFEKYGLDIQVYVPQELCEKTEIDTFGFLENDIILICTKKEDAYEDIE